jgi:hypothetical protein
VSVRECHKHIDCPFQGQRPPRVDTCYVGTNRLVRECREHTTFHIGDPDVIRVHLKFEPIPHPPYSPDLVSCNFYFFPLLKRDLKGNHYTSDDEAKAAVKSWIGEKSEEFFNDGMKKTCYKLGEMC